MNILTKSVNKFDLSKTEAMEVKSRVQNAVNNVINYDNDTVDINSAKGEIDIPSESLKDGKPIVFSTEKPDKFNELHEAQVSFDSQTKEVKDAYVALEEYYTTGPAESKLAYNIMNKSDNGHDFTIYTEERMSQDCWTGEKHYESYSVEVDKKTGEIIDGMSSQQNNK